MNALATQERPQAPPSAPKLFEPAGSTLEDIVLGAWEDLALRGEAECVVCGNALQSRGCTSCGSVLTLNWLASAARFGSTIRGAS